MPKFVYVTTNYEKIKEASRVFLEKHNLPIEIVKPDIEILEIQATSCIEVVKFSAKYAADNLGLNALKSDTGVYIDCIGGLPGPYNAYFDKQIGVEKFLRMIKDETNRKARLEHTFAFCEPGKEPVVFSGGSTGTLSYEPRGTRGRWHDFFFVPDGETKTLSELRSIDEEYEAKFWGNAMEEFVSWYRERFAE